MILFKNNFIMIEGGKIMSSNFTTAITEQEAYDIGIETYHYFYSVIIMDITRKISTNIKPGVEIGKGSMNMFHHMPTYPSGSFKDVIRPNFDTLYSIAWLDITKEPVIVSVPDTGGRYYLLPMMDMWTDVFACLGSRTTGTQTGNFMVTPLDWTDKVPSEFIHIASPTSYVWIIGRTKTDGPSDYNSVHQIQAGYKITPFSQWHNPDKPITIEIDPSIDMDTPPRIQVDTMPADKYFTYAANLIKIISPHITGLCCKNI